MAVFLSLLLSAIGLICFVIFTILTIIHCGKESDFND